MLPNFLIIGEMKCGTTSMANYLMAHPDAFVHPEKELRFFDYRWERGLAWYDSCFTPPPGSTAVGEATPTYLFNPVARERIARSCPRAKLVVMVRNPVDRAYSHYWHWRNREGERRSFASAIDDELSSPSAQFVEWNPEDPGGYQYLARGAYIRSLAALCRVIPRAQVLVVVMEDLAAEPAGTFRAVCRHLGIDSELVPEAVGGVWNGYAHVHHRGLLDMLLRIRAHRVLPDRVARAVFRRTYQTDVRPPPIGPALRARLVDHFSTDNAALADWLDRDLTIWNS